MKSAYLILISFALLVSAIVAAYKPYVGLVMLGAIILQFIFLEFLFVKPILNGLKKYIEEGVEDEPVLPDGHSR
jgi:hypothetical protein